MSSRRRHQRVPLSSLINNLNRAVGQRDAYPFVLTPAILDKLRFVQKVVREAGAVQWTVPGPDGPIPINAARALLSPVGA